MRLRVVSALLVAAIALAAPAAALGAAGCPRTTISDVEDEVMCLQCGVPLNLAEDAPSARRERAFIQGLIDRCRSKQQVKDALVAQFGNRVLADPKSPTAWLVPAIGFGAGAVLVALAALQWRRRRRASPPDAPAPAAPSGSARLDADLERYEL